MEEERGAYEGDLFDAHEPRPWLPGRLASRIKEWRAITSNSYVLSIVATGYSMRREWSSLGEPPPCIKRNNPNCQNHRTFISGAVADMLAMGVVRKRTLEQVHTCLPLNVDVKKSNGKLRLIFDGRYVNIYMLRKHFKMEALHAQGRTVFGGCRYGFIADLSFAYHHLQVREEDWKYLCFQWDDVEAEMLPDGSYPQVFYSFCAIPFGITSAPRVFTEVIREIVAHWRKEHGVRILPWIDDLTGGDVTYERTAWVSRYIVAHLQQLGWIIQQKKCIGVGEPLTRIPSLGLEIDFSAQQYKSSEQRLQQIESMCTTMLTCSRRRVTPRKVSQLAGTIMSQFAALGSAARLRTRSLQACVETRTKSVHDTQGRRSWDESIALSQPAIDELRWWLRHLRQVNGQCIAHVHAPLLFDGALYGDASATGWGGFIRFEDPGRQLAAVELLQGAAARSLLRVTLRQVQQRLRQGVEVMGELTSTQRAKSSTWREMYTALRLLQALITLASGGVFKLNMDNQGAVYLLGGVVRDHPHKIFGGSTNAELQALAVAVFDLAAAHNVTLRAHWIPRELNERADWLSHHNEMQHCHYQLRTHLFKLLNSRFGPHTVDRFALPANTQLPRYNTRYFCEEAEWVDALTTSWKGENNWLFPPPATVAQTLRHLQHTGGSATLIAMHWPGTAWFPLLYPRGEGNEPASFVVERVRLGAAENALRYPENARVAKNDTLPRGQVLAFRLHCK